MDLGYEKEGFAGMRIKVSVAKRFRKFCRTKGKSQSMVLLAMVDFFEINGVSPEDHLGDTISALKGQIIKRSNAVIAIIKNIEKIHHKPTTAILQSLFEETAAIEKEAAEIFDFGTPKLITENEELTYYKTAYYKTQETHNQMKQETRALLKKVNYVKNNFGIGHYRWNITKETLEAFKQKLN